MRYDPHQYQDYATNRIIDTKFIALLLEMGLGKTVSTLTALDLLKYDYFEAHKILVIAPLRVVDDTWPREIEKWDHLQHLTISKVLGTAKQRREALKTDADIYLINRENVLWLVTEFGNKWPFDTVVIDELSSFKSPKSKRFRALRRVRPMMDRVIGLTGTPTPNSLMDLWAPIYLIDQGESLGKTITAYRDRYFVPGKRDGHVVYDWKEKEESEARIYEAISHIAVSMKNEDWLDMPKRIDRTVPVKLSDTSRQLYKQLERDLLLPFVDGDVVAGSAAVLSNKLLQMANGAVYDENRAVKEIHEAKLDALEDIIEAANGHPVLVFYSYKHDLHRMKLRFKHIRELGKGNEGIVEWNAGKIPLLAVHPKSAGHGLNLQDGGSIIVWYGLTWSLEEYQQANARLFRQGQLRSVIIHHLVTEGTMDEQVMAALEAKAAGQDALMDAVKARIERLAERR
jgi:SNF2 family DNA or RNA helicase